VYKELNKNSLLIDGPSPVKNEPSISEWMKFQPPAQNSSMDAIDERFQHSATVYRDTIIVFGGRFEYTNLYDMWAINVSTISDGLLVENDGSEFVTQYVRAKRAQRRGSGGGASAGSRWFLGSRWCLGSGSPAQSDCASAAEAGRRRGCRR
jgi:hypothetical protein